MALIPREVLLVDEEVMVRVQLPETTIKNVEVLIGEIPAHLIDILLGTDLMHRLKQVRVLEVPERYVAIVIGVEFVEYAHHDCVCVALLKLGRLLKKLQAWMLLEQVVEHRLEVLTDNRLCSFLGDQLEEPTLICLPVIV